MKILGHRWDSACGDLRRFLARNQITFEWVTPDAPDLEAKWPGARPADDDCPCCGSPTEPELKRPKRARSGAICSVFRPARSLPEYDTMVIGGGPAGLAAAVYGASEGLRTLVIEREAPGGQAGTSSRIENYLGFPSGVSGDELASRALQQAKRLGAEILVTRSVARVDAATREVFLDGDEVVRGRDPDSRDRRHVAPSGHRGLRQADRQGRLLWRVAQRSERDPGSRHSSDRRRKLGRPSRYLLRQSRAQSDARSCEAPRWKTACRII